jgi:hypothetical protein
VIRSGLAAALVAAAASPAFAFPEGALLGHTGGFGEEHCAACHFGGARHDDLDLAVEGLDLHAPGERHEFFVRVADPRGEVAGFQLALRFEDGSDAGMLEAVDDGAQTGELDGVTYASHDRPQALEDGKAVWRLAWTAPDAGSGPVTLSAAGVSGPDDQSPIGDSTHLLELQLSPED